MEAAVVEHTRTPWALYHSNGTIAIKNPRSHRSKNEIVFWTGFDSSHYQKEALANAAFIVEAVNNYEKMREALTEIRRQCDENIGPTRSGRLDRIAYLADTALPSTPRATGEG
jgi:hypothetical protein